MICRSNAPAPLISLPNDCIELGWPGRENLTRFQNGEIKHNLPQSAVGSDLSTVLACCVVRHPIFYLHMCICVLVFVIEWNNIKYLRRQPHMLKLNEPLAKHTSGKSLQQTWKAPGSGRGAVFKQVTGKSGSTKTWGLLGLLEFLFSCLSTAAQLFCQKHLYLRLFFEGLVWSLAFLTSYKSSKNSLQWSSDERYFKTVSKQP